MYSLLFLCERYLTKENRYRFVRQQSQLVMKKKEALMLQEKTEKNYLMIRLPEEVDHHQALSIRRYADCKILEDGVKDVIFDFEKTRIMDSSGIGLLMGRYRIISTFGGQIYVVNANVRIKKLLLAAGLEKIVTFMNEK